MDIQTIKNKILQDLKLNPQLEMSYHQFVKEGISPELLKEALEQLRQERRINIEKYPLDGVSITLKDI